jgi:phage shock protein A
MKKIILGLTLLLSFAACGSTEDPTAALRAENAALTDQVTRLEARLAKLEREVAQLDSRGSTLQERLRDVAGVVDKVTVRLDRVEQRR